MILKQLKQATREHHLALEYQMPILDPLLSHENYQQLLSRFYGYYAPLEAQLLALSWWDEIDLDYNVRYKTPSLERDLIALGNTSDSLTQFPRCQELPEITTLSNLLGCLYVIEGATLGGQIITKHLQANLSITPESGSAFFNGYGAETSKRWQAFCMMLTSQAEQIDDDEGVISTANQTFASLEQWLFPKTSKPLTLL